MAVLGILTCEILELEFARLLTEDVDVGRISVLEDRYSRGLIEHLEARPHPPITRLPHVHAFRREPEVSLEVLVRVLELGLHRQRDVLRHALTQAAQELAPHVDALLLGYGLCGSALDDPRRVLDVSVPVFLPMDHGHPVDDCVALCLGGRENYSAEQHSVPGTFFLTPGWCRHWQRMLDPRSGEMAQPALKRVLSGYERALIVQTPAMSDDEMWNHGLEFSRKTGLRLETHPGTLKLLCAAWADAKHALRPITASSEEDTAE
jgi:hypothetical protein